MPLLSTIPHRDSRCRHFFGVGGVEEKARPSCRDGDDDDEEPDDDDDDEEPDDDGRDGGATDLDEGTSWRVAGGGHRGRRRRRRD